MGSTGYASRIFSTPKEKGRLTVSCKVDKHPSKKKKKKDSQVTISDLLDLTAQK